MTMFQRLKGRRIQYGKIITDERTGEQVFVEDDNLIHPVTCKDCKHFKHDADCFGDCTLDGGMQRTVYTTDYCSLAERKEE